jgi:hypothetical protein
MLHRSVLTRHGLYSLLHSLLKEFAVYLGGPGYSRQHLASVRASNPQTMIPIFVLHLLKPQSHQLPVKL